MFSFLFFSWILFFCLDILILIFCFDICISIFCLDIWIFIFCFDICIFIFSWIFGLVMTALSDLHIIFNSNVVRGFLDDHIVSNIWEKSKLLWFSFYLRIFNHIVIIIVRYSLLTPGYILRHQRISWGAGDNRSGTFKASSRYNHHHHYCCCYHKYNHYHHGERMLC